MANFRCERLFVMLDEPVPGLDHLKAVDPVEFAHLGTELDAERLGLTPLEAFIYAPFDRPRWTPAAVGLETVRGLIAFYQDWLLRGQGPRDCPEAILNSTLQVLRQVEAVLDAADTRDRRFYFKARDLG